MSARSGEDQSQPEALGPPLAAYIATFAVYLVLGYLFRSVVLNWIIGPLFLVGCLHVVPRLLGRRAPKAAG